MTSVGVKNRSTHAIPRKKKKELTVGTLSGLGLENALELASEDVFGWAKQRKMCLVRVVVGVQHGLEVTLVKVLARRKTEFFAKGFSKGSTTGDSSTLVSASVQGGAAVFDRALGIAEELEPGGGAMLFDLTGVGDDGREKGEDGERGRETHLLEG